MIRSKLLLPLITIFLLLLVWQISVSLLDTPIWILPSPIDVTKTVIDSFAIFMPHLLSTIKLVLIGFLIALIFGVTSGYILHSNQILRDAIFPIFVISQNIPTVVLAPLFLIWFGLGDFPKIIVITITAFFPIATATINGLDNCDKTLLHYLEMAGANKKQIFYKLKLPYALPSIFTGIKISATYAISTAVVAEWLGAEKGIGVFMTLATSSYQTSKVFMATLYIVALSLIFVGFITIIERIFRKYQR